MGIDDESSGVRLPTFDGTDAKWHVWKAKFVAYACYKGFEGILNGDEVSHSSPPVPAVRRSERTNKGQYNRTKYIDEVYLTMLDQTKHDNFYKKQLAYSAELLTCFDSCSQHY